VKARTCVNRRTFTKTSAAAAVTLTAAQASRVLGANDRVCLGFIGVANRGGQLISAFQPHADMEIVALCDVCRTTLEKANSRVGGKARLFGDFRKLIDAKDVDAVVIATPDHWHAIQTITACRAGKDVYVEKPLSMTIVEGRRMVQVARETKRVVQVGIHRRSSRLYAQAEKLIQADKIGKVSVCRCYHAGNMYPLGIGKAQASAPPADLDWEMWLGPRPLRPFQENIAPYKFRWWHLYSSQVANQGVHFLDLTRWICGDLAPEWVAALGGKFVVDDDRTIPDTMEVTFQVPAGRLIVFGQYEASGNPPLPQPGFVELRGTQGTAYIDDARIKIIPERGGQFQDRKPRMEETEILSGDLQQPGKGNKNLSLTAPHARNFLDWMRSRALPAGDVEIGHRSTTFSHLANISLATRSMLQWDAKQEKILNHPQANALLHYEYRKPWSLD